MVCGGIRTRIDLRSRLVEQSPSPFDHRYVTDCEALAFKYTNALASTVCSWKYSLRSHTGKLLFRDTTNGRSTRQTNDISSQLVVKCSLQRRYIFMLRPYSGIWGQNASRNTHQIVDCPPFSRVERVHRPSFDVERVHTGMSPIREGTNTHFSFVLARADDKMPRSGVWRWFIRVNPCSMCIGWRQIQACCTSVTLPRLISPAR